MTRIWTLSNTGVRNSLRLQDGLRVYAQSRLVGNIHGRENEMALEQLLAKAGLLTVTEKSDGTYGRKWRYAWGFYGFIYTKVTGRSGFKQDDIGNADDLTPLGLAFIRSDTYSATEELFLRALSVPMETAYDGSVFSPLRWTLKVLLELEKRTGSAHVNFNEFAIYIQTSDPSMDLNNIVENILRLRENKEQSTAKKVFDRRAYEKAKIDQEYDKEAANYKEYGDMNLRSLRASGIFQRKGRGIAIVPELHSLAIDLAKDVTSNASLLERYTLLYNIQSLPTDSVEGARDSLNDIVEELKKKKIVYDMSQYKLDTVAEINAARLSLQNLLDINNEEQYALNQRSMWSEISEYMRLISKRGGTSVFDDGTELYVPKEECAAYLEWVIWRSFLAIDSLHNKPYDVRSFNVDKDFFPVNTASGGKADLIAEFQDCVVVGEVTLSSGSRQEAMEGEPVRRHVADLMKNYNKPVYGLFIANAVDTNTAETFRSGIWYLKDDSKLDLEIIPLSLEQYNQIFCHMFKTNKAHPLELVTFLKKCETGKNYLSAPEWKNKINSEVASYIN